MRPVIDLSSLNKFIVNEHFQMENLTELPKDVAFIRRFYDKYRFIRCLPFCVRARDFPKVPSLPLEGNILPVQGSSVRPVQPPEFLRKSLKPVAAFLRRKAIRVLIYLDDFLLLAAPVERAVKNTQ